MQPIRILIVDDHQIFREGVRLLLEKEADLAILAETDCGLEALKLVREVRPDILLLDISLRSVCGLEILQQVKSASPLTRVIILSSHENVAYIRQGFENGARGYVAKGSCFSDLLTAIRAVHAGRTYVSEHLEQKILGSMSSSASAGDRAESSFASLSPREQEVFRLIVEGLSTDQVSDMLCISTKTVDKHRASIMRKTGLDNPAKMVQFAIRYGLIDPQIWQE